MNEWHEDKRFRSHSSEMNLRATWYAPGVAGLKKPDSSGAYRVARELHSRAKEEARKEIDWEEVRSRLRESQLALEKALVADPERIEAAYRQRAVRLASRQVQAEGPALLPALVFSLRAERYALELTAIREVFPFSGCAPVPKAPPALLGVLNVRGEIRPVVDLARLLDLPAGEEDASGHVLMLRRQGHPVGVRVGRVEGVRQVSPEELTVPGREGADRPAHNVRGLTSDMLILLNTEAILSHPIFQEVSRP